MSLSERSRAVLYRRLTRVIDDEEAVGEMLTELTAVDAAQMATKDFVRAEIAAATTRIIMWMIGIGLVQLGLLAALFG